MDFKSFFSAVDEIAEQEEIHFIYFQINGVTIINLWGIIWISLPIFQQYSWYKVADVNIMPVVI